MKTDMEQEKQFFDCMSCGHESEVAAAPAKCPECGSGSGVLSPRSRAQMDASSEAFRRAADKAKGRMA